MGSPRFVGNAHRFFKYLEVFFFALVTPISLSAIQLLENKAVAQEKVWSFKCVNKGF
jgi:hypothetical protein